MNVAAKIIEKFGGITRLSSLLGHKNLSTVHSWKKRGYIPARRQQDILDLAHKEGIALAPEDFFHRPHPGDGLH